jgi:hypothetical protein
MRRIPDLNPKAAKRQETLFDTHRHLAFFTTVATGILDTVAAQEPTTNPRSQSRSART